jgi:hypothetical protein
MDAQYVCLLTNNYQHDQRQTERSRGRYRRRSRNRDENSRSNTESDCDPDNAVQAALSGSQPRPGRRFPAFSRS